MAESTALTLMPPVPTETQLPASSAQAIRTAADPNNSVHRSWGSSLDWVLELRDGKRISIPLSLIRQPTMADPSIPESSDEPKVLLLEGFDDLGSSDEGDRDSGDDGEEGTISVAWEDPELPEERGIVVCEENESVLEVEPLASLGPDLRGSVEEDFAVLEPSEWVRGKYEEFGEYLGASYEGYEVEVLNLLKSIDARRPQQPQDKECSVKRAKSGGRGS